MEELIGKVVDQNISDYMSESLSCYMAGAYRGSIILSFIALFDDISTKLGELAKINGKAKQIHKSLKEKQDNQEVFETFVVNQLRSNGIITELEASTIDLVKQRRNKAAHPSGHHPSAEEARFVFSEVINKFLCKPTLTTIQLAEEILARISNSNFFTSSSVSDGADIVEVEIEKLHHETYPYLISKLVEISDEAGGAKKNNATFFLNSLARLNVEPVNKIIAKLYIDKKADDSESKNKIIAALSSNPLILNEVKKTTIKRFKKLLQERIENLPVGVPVTRLSHPSTFFRRLINDLPPEKVLELFNDELKIYIEIFPYSNFLPAFMENDQDLKKYYIDLLKNNASSSQFSDANSFVENIVNLEENLVEILSEPDCLELILGIISAARHNAFSAIDMRNAKFRSIKRIKAKANRFFKADPKKSRRVLKEELGPSYNITKFKKAFFQ